RGRIWRIVPENFKRRPRPALGKEKSEQLVSHLADDNFWWRITAQRLLVERHDRSAIKALEAMARQKESAVGRAHALWTLHGLNATRDALLEEALKAPEAGVREQALRIAEEQLARSPGLLPAVMRLVDDPSSRVRFQLAITLGASDSPKRLATLAALLRNPASDSWTQTAILSSCRQHAGEMLASLVGDENFRKGSPQRQREEVLPVAALAAASATDAELVKILSLLKPEPGRSPAAWEVALLEGLGDGLRSGQRSLARLLETSPPVLKDAAARVRPFFESAATTARAGKQPLGERLAAVRLLGHGPY